MYHKFFYAHDHEQTCIIILMRMPTRELTRMYSHADTYEQARALMITRECARLPMHTLLCLDSCACSPARSRAYAHAHAYGRAYVLSYKIYYGETHVFAHAHAYDHAYTLILI